MADDREQVAVEVIAKHVMHTRCWGGVVGPADYPALSAVQWEQVQSKVAALATAFKPDEDTFHAAYEYLTGEQP